MAGQNNRNPYIIGRPIHETEIFFGRESLFRFIDDNLRQNAQVILLHGQRRIGKSSVLQQIPNFFRNNEFVFVDFDLQYQGQSTLSSILHCLANDIIDRLQLEGRVQPPNLEELAADTKIFSDNFLPSIYQAIGESNLVLLLDEFDVLDNQNNDIVNKGARFFDYLKSLTSEQKRFFIIPVVGRHVNDLENLLSLFRGAPYQEIGFLDDLSAQRLIKNPARTILTYEQEALQEIRKLSGGHPYFTQVICSCLFTKANLNNNWTVTHADVESVVDKAIESAEASLPYFWDGLSISERVIFSAVAEAQKIAIEKKQSLPEEPLTLLKNYGVIETNSLVEAAKKLAKNGFLDDTGRRVKVELVRLWLVKRHPLRKEIWQLEQLDIENVTRLCEVANSLKQQGKKDDSLRIYEQVLVLNPNHFNTVLSLAEEYLENQNFDKALELYERSYQFDQANNKECLVNALQKYGHELITQQTFSRAKKQFSRILKIDPDREFAQQRLKEIAVFIRRSNSSIQIQRKQVWIGLIAVATIATVGFGAYRVATPCPPGQQKVLLGIGCEPDTRRISRGDRTLFPNPNIKNTNRDRGIAVFKKGNYSEAAQFFKNAVVDNRNDPEVLIYYNNALAKQQGSPITLAVVVPVDNREPMAKEILRGVAQAQNQFNQKGGLNGRLLEIVIANDGNEPDRAKQIAAELVKDPSVLGVIGHNSSDATKQALDEYKLAEVAIISPTSTSTSLRGDNFFRTVPSDADAGKKLAEYARKTLNLNTVAIFFNPDSSYSDSLREEFTKNFEKLGGSVVRKINLTEPKFNPETEVAKSLWRYKAQAIVLFPDTQKTDVALKIVTVNAQQTAMLKTRPQNPQRQGLKLLGGDALYSQITLDKDVQSEGLILAVSWFREAPEAKNFAIAARQQWGGDVNWRTATSYDATQAFIQALSPNPTRATVLRRLKNINLPDSQTSGYPLKFTSEGELQSESILVKVERGEFRLLQQR
ncbi:branched-chain amino acid ABC transporter substrate-binding protein [Tychonema bourrellyi FEM_GT703]|uniref:Branched-chain amino acid ABC transporter substrate-binding protein n=2 Tax=Tychonema bourrellyi TaxID=54313 RepID=A0A2G4EY27_9CYAN|nr:branched-chain amino acid ABC transporter substrate-binding protein [Tychonema bourrellyi FEM_GT703]